MQKLREILVIDDDKVACFLHSTLMEDMEVSESIHFIHDAEKALEYLQEGIKRQVYPDLILLDVNMSGMDSLEFLESLVMLRSEEIGKLNIVMLSATISQKHKEAAAIFGDLLKGHFLMPLDETLLEKILRLIPYDEGIPKVKKRRKSFCHKPKAGGYVKNSRLFRLSSAKFFKLA